MEVANSVAELDMSCDFAYLPMVNIGSGCSNQVGSKCKVVRGLILGTFTRVMQHSETPMTTAALR